MSIGGVSSTESGPTRNPNPLIRAHPASDRKTKPQDVKLTPSPTAADRSGATIDKSLDNPGPAPPESSCPLADAFPTWAHFNDVHFDQVKLQDVGDGKGIGLLAEADLQGGSDAAASTKCPTVLLRIPHDLVLSADAVDAYAKVDKNFRQLFEAAGRQSTRGDVMLYLISHLAQTRRPGGLTPTPWTEYIRFLPRSIPLPTMWADPERLLLKGTSLEAALKAKLAALDNEFDQLRERSEALPFWNSLWWAEETIAAHDWILADAWYRSRCLDLPRSGNALVSAVDMVNHSSEPSAYYEEDDQGNAVLLLRPAISVAAGEEVTISYGAAKPASEMLFSYGFIDLANAVYTMTLPLDPFPDDPLSRAKTHVFGGLPALTLSQTEAEGDAEETVVVKWHAPFVYLMCINEEDGLSFQLLQDTEGGRQLRLLWQGDDVTDQANNFESLIQSHALCQVFKLRVATVLHQTVEDQLAKINSGPPNSQLELLQEAGVLRPECVAAANALKSVESKVLQGALNVLDHEKATLLADDHVVAYLRSMEESPMGHSTEATSANSTNEVDFEYT
ncbi:hypothetical protein QQS21_002196 [Conoideocrella luteorostrata]|uniref:SET domain-containing protein n=1 Tax=Conoideocrella luteorostrata TaxID=1105319 RepID=A0AAJ0G326_9HYPO|nr:hypothetical protein QQS21_002196 [Conoideocrella luteorostrata]